MSDVRIYGIGSIILVLAIGYFVYLLYQDVIFIKNEIKEIKSSENHENIEEDEEYDGEENDADEEDNYDDYFENYENEDLHSHLNSLTTIKEEPVQSEIMEEPVIQEQEIMEEPVVQEEHQEVEEKVYGIPSKRRRSKKQTN